MRRVYIRRFQTKNKNKQDKYIFLIFLVLFYSPVSLSTFIHTQNWAQKEKKRRKNNSQRAMIDACESNFSNGGKNEENARGTTAGRVDQESGK
jgi:hypothetical protein